MTTFIPYRPWENAPSFNGRTFCKSSTVDLPSWVLKRQSLQHPEWARPWSMADSVELVALTASDHQDAVQEYPVDRKILEPVVPDSAEQCVRVARDGDRDGTDSDNEDDIEGDIEPGNDDSEDDNEGDIEHGNDDSEDDNEGDIEHGNDNDDNEGDDNDHNSEASDLPSLEDIFAQLDKERMARKEHCREGDCTDRASPAASAASSLWPGANQDNPIMLDDDEAADTHEVAAPDAGKPSFEVADLVDRYDPSPTLPGVLTEPGTDDGTNAQNSLARYPIDSRGNDEEKRGDDLHEDEVSHNDNVACGESGGDGMGSNAPPASGLIHDVFAEYEKTFGMARRKQKAARSAPHDCEDSDMAAGSIPQPIRLEEPQAVTDDGVTSVEQPTEVTRDGVSPRKFSRELENGFTSQPRQESNRQGTQTVDVRSKRLSRVASDCRPENALTLHTPSRPRMTADETIRSDPSAVIQGARSRKRSRPSAGPAILPPNDGAPPKRPRRVKKETWKAREAREELEAKRTRASSGPSRKI